MATKRLTKRTTRRTTQAATYKVLRRFQYYSDPDVRKRIKASHEDGGPEVTHDERGGVTRHEAGATLQTSDLPADVLAACTRKRALEVISKPKEATE